MVIDDAWLAVTRRWRRNLLTALAVASSTATVVMLVAFVYSAAARTAETLTGLSADEISVTLPYETWDVPEPELIERLRDVPEITGAGTMVMPDRSRGEADILSPRSGMHVRAGVATATRSGLAARGAVVVAGSYPSLVGLQDRSSVLLGRRLAADLRIGDAHGATIVVNGTTMSVAGIVADKAAGGILSASLILDPGTAERLSLLPASRIVQVSVTRGTAEAIAPWLATAIHPAAADRTSVTVPPSPRRLQEQLTAEAAVWTNVITGVLVIVSAFAIMTSMQIAVQERRREIGIRRAMGTSALRIGVQFCCEALIVGTVSAFVGGSVGMIAIAAYGSWADWAIHVPAFLALVPAAGMTIGGVSGLVPAQLAARIDPAELLRAT